MTITHRGEDENKSWLILFDLLAGSPVEREAVGYSSLVLPIDKVVI
jgi:mannose/fructose-specific phosphotransferase system component IIA